MGSTPIKFTTIGILFESDVGMAQMMSTGVKPYQKQSNNPKNDSASLMVRVFNIQLRFIRTDSQKYEVSSKGYSIFTSLKVLSRPSNC